MAHKRGSQRQPTRHQVRPEPNAESGVLSSRRQELSGAPTAQMEEELEEEQPKERLVTLKSGAIVDAGFAAARVETFRSFLERHPDRFVALRDLATGQSVTPPAEILQVFRDIGFLDSDGRLKEEIQSIFLASYRELPDGPCFVSPFDPTTADEVDKLRDLERGQQRRFTEVLKHLRPRTGDDTPKRG